MCTVHASASVATAAYEDYDSMAWVCCGSMPGVRSQRARLTPRAASGPDPIHTPLPQPQPAPAPEPAPAVAEPRRRAGRRERAEAAAIREVKQHRKRRLQREQAASIATVAAKTTTPEAASVGEADGLPDGWAMFPPQCPTSMTVAVPLDEEEAVAVRGPFEEVGLRVLEVLRVQNRALWLRFASERALLARLHGAGWEPNERRLYHATGQDALALAEGPGLDERFSSAGGNLGRAIYCASHPRKAHQCLVHSTTLIDLATHLTFIR